MRSLMWWCWMWKSSKGKPDTQVGQCHLVGRGGSFLENPECGRAA